MTKSKFSASLGAYYGFEVVQFLASIFSLTLLMPYVVFAFEKWRVESSEISGHNLHFLGKLWQAYAIYGAWLVVFGTIASLSNYLLYYFGLLLTKEVAFWLVNAILVYLSSLLLEDRYRTWVRRHLSFDGTIAPTYLKEENRRIRIVLLKAWAISFFTFHLLAPYAHEMKMKCFASLTKVNSLTLKFTNTSKQMFKFFLPGVLLTIVTLGLYLPVLHYKIYNWRIQGLQLVK